MPASFAQRMVAYVIDGFIVSIPGYVLWFLWWTAMMGASAAGASDDVATVLFGGGILVFYPLSFVITFLYFGYFWSKNGQTPGKKVMNIRVERPDGSLQTFVRGGLRGTFGYWISAIILFLGFIWAAFDANQEAWHDKLFETRVVRA